ncbi:cytochrome P450 [Bacillus sp. B15-48]|uniref:cytochrome P450 n=1 Tax=Bacillus sp. B15-48 TaxID=1548601 RepID=UPI00194009DC|nr:cytochrome P450 [Bacillus sp. B15-48]MBM4763026.1 cytochrome P450 [Bacillus sp. B15-48]
MSTNIDQTRPISFPAAEFFQNPYPFYEQLRSIHPIYQGTLLKYSGWYVTGYEEAIAILKDTRFKNRTPLPQTSKQYEKLKTIQNNMMLFKNQPDHRRLRSLINNVFTTRMVEKLRPSIQETVNDLLQQLQNRKSMDVISDFAFPLASTIIANILGVPKEDRLRFREWAVALIQTIDFTRSRKALDSGNNITMILSDYFKELIQKRKQNPEKDLISLLIKEEQEGNRLSDEELLATCILLVIAGHETTVNLISNSILALLKSRDQMLKLQENPSLIEDAIEEFLRYESPTQMTARVASEDIEIHDVNIKKGDQVYILLGAANRDPNKFTHAHLLDITRNPNPHLAFGYGTHFCLGAPLARLEAQIAIATFLQKVDNPHLATARLPWRKLMGFRSLNELVITLN